MESLRVREGFRDLISMFTKYQFLSPLYIHHNQSNFVDTTSGSTLGAILHQLSDSELELLHQCHFLINSINQQCIQKITNKFPELESCLNPYDMFMKIEFSEFSTNKLVETGLIQSLVDSFEQHEAFQSILTQIPEEHIRLHARHLPQKLEEFFNIVNKSINDMPYWINQVPQQNSDDYWAYYLVRYSARINSILSNIDQLIYQAFLKKHLIVLNEDNIIYIAGSTSNFMCEETTITIQSQSDTIFCLPSEIVLIQYVEGERQVKSLARIMNLTFSFRSESQGMTQECALRMIDESLSSYFN
jgi:hypothetical protein